MKYVTICCLVLLIWTNNAFSEEKFAGAPNGKLDVFIKLNNHLDDPNRGLCIDIPGHLSSTDIRAALVVHTCKDGFWNYDGRFLQKELEKSNRLFMPAFKLCVAAAKPSRGAQLILAECDAGDTRQGWKMNAGQLQLKAAPELCIEVDSKPSEVSIGTRNHPVRHLVRPITLAQCTKEKKKYQHWGLVVPSEIPGIRYPDGQPGNW